MKPPAQILDLTNETPEPLFVPAEKRVPKKKNPVSLEEKCKQTKNKVIEKIETPTRKVQTRAVKRKEFNDECWGPGRTDPGEPDET